MKHARSDYNRIQDPLNLIPKEEPVFLLRGQDRFAPMVVEAWAKMAEERGANKNIVEAAFGQARAMYQWQEDNKEKMPDLPSAPEIHEVFNSLVPLPEAFQQGYTEKSLSHDDEETRPLTEREMLIRIAGKELDKYDGNLEKWYISEIGKMRKAFQSLIDQAREDRKPRIGSLEDYTEQRTELKEFLIGKLTRLYSMSLIDSADAEDLVQEFLNKLDEKKTILS